MQQIRILHLEDSPLDSTLVSRQLEKEGYLVDLERVETREAFSSSLDGRYDVILIDHDLPGFNSFDALDLIRRRRLGTPAIVVSGVLSEEAAVGTLKRGASDFVLKDRMARLGPAVAQALRERDLRSVARRERAARRRGEKLAESVLSVLPQQVAVVNSEGHIRLTNGAWRHFARERAFRLVISDDTGFDYLTALRSAERAGDQAASEALGAIREVLGGERRMYSLAYPTHSEEREQWFSLTVATIWDASGAVIIHEDITQHRLRQRELEDKDRRLQALFENSLDAILITDDEARYVEANPAACRMFGYSKEELLQSEVWDLTQPGDRELAERAWSSFIEQGTQEGEMTLRRRDGSEIVAEYRATASILPGLHLSILRDVTERKMFESDFVDARYRAEAGARAKSTLLANLTHETRTPLTAILGFSELLISQCTGEAVSFGREIATNGRRLLNTFESLIEMARIEAGERSIEPDEINLYGFVSEVVDEVTATADEKALALNVEPPAEPIRLYADPSALLQVLRQLIGNAIKFTEEGSVSVNMDRREGIVEIRITDTGVGISEEFVPQLFSGFRQESEGDEREFEGFGVGLAVSRYLVALMGGELRVQSVKGQGSTFTVSLPHKADAVPSYRSQNEPVLSRSDALPS